MCLAGANLEQVAIAHQPVEFRKGDRVFIDREQMVVRSVRTDLGVTMLTLRRPIPQWKIVLGAFAFVAFLVIALWTFGAIP